MPYRFQVGSRVLIRYDDQIFVIQRRGGISRYFVELIKAIRATPETGIEALVPKWSRNQHMLDAGFSRAPIPPLRRPLSLALMNRLAKSSSTPHIVHHTFYNKRYLNQHSSSVRVVTIYDMIPELFPSMFPRGNPHIQKRAYVQAADLIICISESTRSDMLNIYGRSGTTITVIPLGVDYDSFAEPLPPLGIDPPYILYVGIRTRYKDFSVAAEALARVIHGGRTLRMLCAGGGGLTSQEERLLDRLGISGRVHQKALTDRELAAAYQHAACFVFPSRYEGFGLPTLEAMAAGCPVVLARSSSHPEVGGEAALYFDPQDAADLAGCIVQILVNAELAAILKREGRERARSFTWALTSSRTLAAYRSALTNGTASGGSDLNWM